MRVSGLGAPATARAKRSARSAGFAALLLCLLGTAAAPRPAAAALTDLLVPQEARLKNGLRVLTLEDPTAAVATFQVWYDVGSRNERPGITGITHLFEHLMFKGSKNVGAEEHTRLVQSVGGVDNAFTTWDVTVYWANVPPDQLELIARLEAERMSTLRLTAENLKSERKVVKEERRYRVEDNPIAKAVEEMTAVAYVAHPYQWPTLGWMSDLDALTLADVQDYYVTHYAPDKATLVVCGPVTHARVVGLAEKYFGKLKPGKPAPPVSTVEPEQRGERRAVVNANAQLPVVIAGYKIPPDSSADTPALEVVSRILSQGQSSRLYKKLVYEDQTALFAGGVALGRKNPGLFYAFAAVKPGKDRAQVEDTLFAVIDRLGRDGPTEEEMGKAKNQAESDFVFGLETPQNRADALGNAALIGGDARRAGRKLEDIRAVTAEDVKRVVTAYLVRDRRTVVWVVPAERSGS
jgi:zinc protease